MTWERCGYICRKVNKTLKPKESVSECIARIENDSSCKLYGNKISFDSLYQNLLSKAGEIRDNTKAQQVLGIYVCCWGKSD